MSNSIVFQHWASEKWHCVVRVRLVPVQEYLFALQRHIKSWSASELRSALHESVPSKSSGQILDMNYASHVRAVQREIAGIVIAKIFAQCWHNSKNFRCLVRCDGTNCRPYTSIVQYIEKQWCRSLSCMRAEESFEVQNNVSQPTWIINPMKSDN